MPAYSALAALNLILCDFEPNHPIGFIQPAGFLIVLSDDWQVIRVSANVEDYLGQSAEMLLGAAFQDVVGPEALHVIRNRLAALHGDAVERAPSVLLREGVGRFDLAVHRVGQGEGQVIVVEAEPSESPGELNAGMMVRSMLDRMQGEANPAREAARLIQALTGFDRVMIYRFSPDGSGEVIAERVRGSLEPYLGLRCPAADISLDARALLLRNPTQMLYDIGAAPSLILSYRGGTDEPFDLSLSTLCTASATRLEYLKNLGVGATMTMSLLRDGALWGLISCHHGLPHHISFEQRTAAELFAQIALFFIERREREELATYEVHTRQIHDQLIATIVGDDAMGDNLVKLASRMTELVPCDGIVVCVDDRVAFDGVTPTREEFLALRRFLNRSVARQIYATDELGGVYPSARDFAMRAAGMLVIPISRSPGDYCVFFRREIIESVTWAGQDGTLEAAWPGGSFGAWRESMRGHSTPWSPAELRAAETLRVTLLEVVLHFTGEAEKESRSATQKQQLLIAELNHRVRNILGLIRGLIAQSRGSAANVDALATVLGDRVQALARAHDQITASSWGPGALAALIATEADACLGLGAGRIHAAGGAVLLEPQAFLTMTMVIHELLTNAAKFGALSVPYGKVNIEWALEAGGDIIIDWLETGGPPIQAPTRRGFGMNIVERSIPHELGGEARLDYALVGLQARFRLPSRYIIIGDAAMVPPAVIPALPGLLSGSVLLVEDNMIIALDAEDMLLALGASRVAVAGNVAEALYQIGLETPSFALLDINLGIEASWPVATRLRELGVPHAFATGYGSRADYPPEHRATPSITKPYSSDMIARVLSDAVEASAQQD
jgi:light-regulated signal transduction histidine kinase (bacteriophytochrome)/CheY-like chemotaxis protein